jgi:hypothetical protein
MNIFLRAQLAFKVSGSDIRPQKNAIHSLFITYLALQNESGRCIIIVCDRFGQALSVLVLSVSP